MKVIIAPEAEGRSGRPQAYVCFPSEQYFGDGLATLGLGATPAEARLAAIIASERPAKPPTTRPEIVELIKRFVDRVPVKPRTVRVDKAPAWVKVELVGRFPARVDHGGQFSQVERLAHDTLGSDPWVYQRRHPVPQRARQKRRRQRRAPEFSTSLRNRRVDMREIAALGSSTVAAGWIALKGAARSHRRLEKAPVPNPITTSEPREGLRVDILHVVHRQEERLAHLASFSKVFLCFVITPGWMWKKCPLVSRSSGASGGVGTGTRTPGLDATLSAWRRGRLRGPLEVGVELSYPRP